MNEENQQEIDVTYSSFRADYTGILDVSPSERLKEWLFQYYARIHTDTKPQYVLSIVCGVFICIQAISPAIMTQALIQQNSSVIAKTIHFLSVWDLKLLKVNPSKLILKLFNHIQLILNKYNVFFNSKKQIKFLDHQQCCHTDSDTFVFHQHFLNLLKRSFLLLSYKK